MGAFMTNQILRTIKNKANGLEFFRPTNLDIRNAAYWSIILSTTILLLFGKTDASARTVALGKDKITVHIEDFTWKSRKGQYDVKAANEKTPDGQNTLQLNLQANNKKFFISGRPGKNFKKLVGNFDVDWENISFWVKPDGSAEKITLLFSAADSKTGKSSYHTTQYSLLGKKWQKVEFKSLYNTNKKRLIIKNLSNIYFRTKSGGKCAFLLGPVSFKLKGTKKLEPVKTTNIYKTPTAPVMDGALNDICWKDAVKIDKFNIKINAPIEVKLCYDNRNLYVGFSQKINTAILKKKQTSSDGTVWADDSLQLIISPGNDARSYHQFIVNALNTRQSYHNYFDQVKDGYNRTRNVFFDKWETAVSVKPDKWSVEMRIPLSFTQKMAKNNVHGLQIYIYNPSLGKNSFWTDATKATKPEDYGIAYLAGPRKDADAAVDAKVKLLFDRSEPTSVVSISPPGSFSVRAQLSNSSGYIAKAEDKVETVKSLKFREYQPKSGVQRLALVIRDNNSVVNDKLLAYKTKDIAFGTPLAYGTDVLVPTPKKNTPRKGRFKLSGNEKIFYGANGKAAAETLRENIYGYLQTKLETVATKSLQSNCLVLGKTATALTAISTKHPYEGSYSLEIAPDYVIMQGDSPRGLFYAVTTLSQIERYAFLRNEKFLNCRTIADWPDLPNRIWTSWFDVLYSRYKPGVNGADSSSEVLSIVYDYLYRLAIGTKMTIFSFQAPSSIRYENSEANHFSHRCAFMTIKDLSIMSQYCRENYIDLVPGLNGPSHANWLTSKRKNLVMPGYSDYDADPTHPDFFKYQFLMYKELIKACKPKYFHIWCDEWWHKPTGQVYSTYNGQEKRDIYLETILKIHRFFSEHKIRIMMFTDMLWRDHNGGKPYNNYLNDKKLPKDIVMCTWGTSQATVKHFAKLGYTSWFIGNLCVKLGNGSLRGVKKFTGLGVINYGSITPDSGYGAAGMIRTADRAWNFWSDSGESLNDWLYKYGPNVMAMYSVLPNPHASTKLVTLDISSQCNAAYSGKNGNIHISGLPQGKNTIGFIPTRIVKQTTAANVIKGSRIPVVIPVNAKAASLIFLHTQDCPVDKRSAFIRMSNTRTTGSYHGVKTGVYVIKYRNGKTVPVYIRNVINCGNWLPFKGRVSTVLNNTFLIDARYVWRGDKVKGQNTCLYQYEWVNPSPDVPIENISFSSTSTVAVPYLFAVTLREPAPAK